MTETFSALSEYPALDHRVAASDVLIVSLWVARDGLITYRDESVTELHCENVLQYLTVAERLYAYNEMWRVLEHGGRAKIVVPYFSHPRAFAHPLTKYPLFTDLSFWFLDKQWRSESPSKHVPGLECDFEVTTLTMDRDDSPELGYALRTQEFLDEAARWYNGVVAQLTVWLTKR